MFVCINFFQNSLNSFWRCKASVPYIAIGFFGWSEFLCYVVVELEKYFVFILMICNWP